MNHFIPHTHGSIYQWSRWFDDVNRIWQDASTAESARATALGQIPGRYARDVSTWRDADLDTFASFLQFMPEVRHHEFVLMRTLFRPHLSFTPGLTPSQHVIPEDLLRPAANPRSLTARISCRTRMAYFTLRKRRAQLQCSVESERTDGPPRWTRSLRPQAWRVQLLQICLASAWATARACVKSST